jgi:hypothetical protein
VSAIRTANDSVKVSQEIADVVRQGYAAFNARDIDGALAAMTTDIVWANGWEGGHVHCKEAVRQYWTRQWQELDPHVTPVDMTADGDAEVVVVDQIVRRPDGTEIRAGTVRHLYELRAASSPAWTSSRMTILKGASPSRHPHDR